MFRQTKTWKYQSTPELEVVEFDCEDVITTSGVNPDENELPIVPIG